MEDKRNVFENVRKIYKVMGELSIENMENPLEINRILGREFFPNMNNFIESVNTTMNDLKNIYDEAIKNKEKLFYDSIEELKSELRKENCKFDIIDGQTVKLFKIQYGKYVENYGNNSIIVTRIKIKFNIDGSYNDFIHVEVYREGMSFIDDKFITSGNIIKYEEDIYVRSILPHYEYDTPLFRDESIVEAIINDDNLYKYIEKSFVSGYIHYDPKEKASLLKGFVESDSWDTHMEPIDEKGTFITVGIQYWKPEGINPAQYSIYAREYIEKDIKIENK